jgi:hypothetical protein
MLKAVHFASAGRWRELSVKTGIFQYLNSCECYRGELPPLRAAATRRVRKWTIYEDTISAGPVQSATWPTDRMMRVLPTRT